jgi:DNA repair protein RecN (Recombination protein N)
MEQAERTAREAYDAQARLVSRARRAAAPALAQAVTQALQTLGMAGGRFEVALLAQEAPQSFGMESAEFLVAGHAGSTPRALARVASGGELSRIALAIAVTTATAAAGAEASPGTLIFDEIDAGVGGAVAETVGRLMKRLGRERQVLAVTHLPQVAACADAHWLVSKAAQDGRTFSDVAAVAGEARVAEIARMLGGERLSGTSIAHAQEMLAIGESIDRERPVAAARIRKRS